VEGAAIHFASYARAKVEDATLKTDRDGKFQATLDPERKQRLVIAKEGFAPELIDPATLKDAAPVSVALKAAQPLRLKIVDPDGRPIAKAWVLVTAWRGTAFRESISTGADGQVVWPSAPADEVQVDVVSEGYRSQQSLRVKPSADPQTITLTPAR
jgi:hypothetical protein